MNKFIQQYLSLSFKLKNGVLFDNYGSIIDSETLTERLGLIYGLSHKQLKWYVKSWFKKQNKSVNFNKWWVETKRFGYIISRDYCNDIEIQLTTILS